eukprot:TRINITY_DN6550_c0_g1_i1.p1 TRINITY_DN6550_c0_g1~~TRINITY_DN6550_c0_g1_i1.p1  ORF type:complete len:150 (-),score=30.56 TRINITY_DN6550_c0_g1_i1:44-493(-)
MSVANVLLRRSHRPMWHLVDAKDQIVGRLATQIAPLLVGKHKPTYSPNVACGDIVVVINAADVQFTGKKWTDKVYRWHSGYPGGLKERTPKQQLERRPEEILRRAVMGMLPKNKLRSRMILQLKIYEGPAHPHEQDLRGKSSILQSPDD